MVQRLKVVEDYICFESLLSKMYLDRECSLLTMLLYAANDVSS